MSRVAFLHTGAVVIPTFRGLADELLPGVEVQNLLDDRIVGDLGSGRGDVRDRLRRLVEAAAAGGADAVMLTCSSISGYAAELQEHAGLPVLRVDEAMADEAVRLGTEIAVVATLETTLNPTRELLLERARLAGAPLRVRGELVDGAFTAVASGDVELHDRLVREAILTAAESADAVVLAQASMVSAARSADVSCPVLASPRFGVERLAQHLAQQRAH